MSDGTGRKGAYLQGVSENGTPEFRTKLIERPVVFVKTIKNPEH